MGGEFVYVPVVRVGMPSKAGNRRSRNLYRRWSEELLEGG